MRVLVCVSETEPSYASRIQRLEEAVTFLDDHVSQQDKVILELQKKLDRASEGIKELREQLISGGLNSPESVHDEKPPHY